MSGDEPLSIYRERLPNVRRVIELRRDAIVVRARWLIGGSYAQTIPLNTLTPETRQIWVRQKLFKRSLAVAALAAATAVVFTRSEVGATLPAWAAYALYAVAVIAGGIAVMTWPKVLFVRFPRRDGRPGLDVAKAGPDAGRFEAFVDEVRRQVRRRPARERGS